VEMDEISIPIHHKIGTLRGKQLLELERKNNKKFKEIFRILDSLVFETKQTDEKVMGFLKS